jgi:DNA-directed RNA polymerase subunit alpha
MKWKSLHMPRAVQIDETALTDTYGKFVLQPLERGFGTTIGNALRRVLLSSIHGAAIKSVKIEGVYHEFSTVPGVVEDVPEIILNLKEVCLRLHADEDRTVAVERRGPGELKAGDMQVDAQVEIVNPDLHIASLDEGGALKMELVVGGGRGYVFAEDNKRADQSLGVIAIDSIFSPIRKVHYEIENARVGRRTDYDRLTLEVWTNGAMKPDDALSFAAKILKDHLELFIHFEEEGIEDIQEEVVDQEAQRIGNLLKMPVEELELSVRSANCLRAAGILALEDLVQKTEPEMLKYRNFGRKSLNELNAILNSLGLSFGMDISQYKNVAERKKEVVALEEDF